MTLSFIGSLSWGANVIDKIICETRIGSDKNSILIALLKKARDNFDEIPKTMTKEEFCHARDIYQGKIQETMEDWKLGAYSWLGSFGTKGFCGSYAQGSRTDTNGYYQERYRNLEKQVPNLKGIDFICSEYDSFTKINNALIYCDPPYEGTQGYGYAKERVFSHKNYWNWVREMSKTNYVLCSEAHCPADFTILEEKTVKRILSATDNKTNGREILCYYPDGLLQF